MTVRGFCKLLKVQHYKRRVRDGFAEYRFRVLPESRFQFFRSTVRIHESSLHAHLADRVGIEIICTSVKCRRTYNVVPGLGDVHDCIEVCSLPG